MPAAALACAALVQWRYITAQLLVAGLPAGAAQLVVRRTSYRVSRSVSRSGGTVGCMGAACLRAAPVSHGWACMHGCTPRGLQWD